MVRLSGADTFWLRADRPENRTVVTAVLALEGRLEPETLQTLLQDRLIHRDRFRRPVVLRRGRAFWGDDRGFVLDRHVEHLRLPGSGGDTALRAWLGQLMATPLPSERPPWQVFLVDGLDEGSVVVARIHHCIADGIALVQLLLSLTDELDGSRGPFGSTDRRRSIEPEERPSRSSVLPGHLFGRLVRAGLDRVRPTRVRPSRLLHSADGLASSVAKWARLAAGRPSLIGGQLGIEKSVAWSPPLPLESIKVMAHRANGKVNDVLLAMTTGALRRILIDRGTPPDEGRPLWATVPVNLRRRSKAEELGNQFGLVFLRLPVHLDTAKARLEAVKRDMDRIKSSPEALVSFGLMRGAGHAPTAVEAELLRRMTSGISVVLTNVAGPRSPLLFAGKRLSRLMFWVPQSGSIGLGLSLISYAGEVSLGVAADRATFPEAEALAAALCLEHALMGTGLGIDDERTTDGAAR